MSPCFFYGIDKHLLSSMRPIRKLSALAVPYTKCMREPISPPIRHGVLPGLKNLRIFCKTCMFSHSCKGWTGRQSCLPAAAGIRTRQGHTRAYEIQYCVPMNMRNQKLLRTSCNNYSRSARSRPMILSYFAHAAVAAQITTPFCLKLLRAFGFSTKELWRKSGVVKFPKVNI